MLIDLTLPVGEDNLFAEASPVAHLGHVGTHLDKDPGEIVPLDRYILPAQLLDVSAVRGRRIEPEDLDGSDMAPGGFIVLRTGWLNEAYPDPSYLETHPELSNSSLDLLISWRPAMVGIDAPGLGRPERHGQVDRRLATHGIFVVENLANLEALRRTRFTIYCFPMALTGTSGVPVRVVAEVD